jgi:hypothetical protein
MQHRPRLLFLLRRQAHSAQKVHACAQRRRFLPQKSPSQLPIFWFPEVLFGTWLSILKVLCYWMYGRQTGNYPETGFEEINGDLREADLN